jgi:FAD/FMN-containing dehydrogenase
LAVCQYYNFVNGLSEPNDELMKTVYGPNYARLARIKKRYDPTNVLGLNPNIKPA